MSPPGRRKAAMGSQIARREVSRWLIFIQAFLTLKLTSYSVQHIIGIAYWKGGIPQNVMFF